MKNLIKPVALAAMLSLMAGVAVAADGAMKDCCAKCDCCQDKKAEGQTPAPSPEHKH